MSEAARLLYVLVEGEERVPFSLAQVRTMFETGLVTPETMFRKTEEWRPLVSALSGTCQPAQPLDRCFLRIGGTQQGPFMFDQIRSMWKEGRLTLDAACKFGEIWQPLARVVPILSTRRA